MDEMPDAVTGRIGARMMDFIAAEPDPSQRAWLAEQFEHAQFLIREDTAIDVVAATEDGVVTLARLDGATVGVFVGADGQIKFRDA